MDPEGQEESQEIVWTIIVQCFKERGSPPVYKVVMNYYGDEPIPILRCESEQSEWTKEE